MGVMASFMLLCAATLLTSCQPHGQQEAQWHLTLHQAQVARTQGQILIHSGLDLLLSPDVEQALHQGIALRFNVQLRSARHYRFWALLMDQQTHTWTINYLPLSRQYRLTSPTGQQRLYTRWRHLNAALKEQQHFVFDLDSTQANFDYQVQLRAALDLQSLPAPLRLPALFSAQWRLASGWNTWLLAPA